MGARDRTTDLDRRTFLKGTAGLAAGALALSSGSGTIGSLAAEPDAEKTKEAKPHRPNILLFFTDQERSIHLPPLNLPNRERLVKHSLTFTHTHAAYPLCSPNRASLLTGLYAHQHGVIENTGAAVKLTEPLDEAIPNLGSVFQSAGYDTAYFGKWHLSHPLASLDAPISLKNAGFEQSWIPPGENAGVTYDQVTAEEAAKWIESREGSKPWFCVVSIINPHDLFYADWYKDVDIPERDFRFPGNVDDDVTTAGHPTEIVKEGQRFRKLSQRVPGLKDWQKLLDRYVYLLERSDGQLGTVLDALDRKEAGDNTVVVYTSDHGEMAGSHGLINKRFMYAESVQVPLIFSCPHLYKDRTESDLLVSTVDIAPTLADMAGIVWPTPLPGQSLKDVPWKDTGSYGDAVFAESHMPPFPPPKGPEDLIKMIRTRQWKYIQYPSGSEELYNETDDPLELTSLIGNPEYGQIKTALQHRLKAWQDRTPA